MSKKQVKSPSIVTRPLHSPRRGLGVSHKLLEKNAKFEFDEAYRSAFEEIKAKLIIAPIMATSYWS